MPPRTRALLGVALAALVALAMTAPASGADASDPAATLRQALAEGRVAYGLTGPEEIRALLGAPRSESRERDGGMSLLLWEYADFTVAFGTRAGSDMPPGLVGVQQGGAMWDIGRDRPLVLRTPDDLARLDPFTGLQNVDLRRLDLRPLAARLQALPFDTRTRWPGRDSLPAGFDPAAELERGRDPGLGVRALHRRGIDGRGVGIAIVDQPLLLPHDEYAVTRLDSTGLAGFPPQMHGPAVLSVAAGRTCGVAPGATVHYFAVPMWENANRHYVAALEKILALNRTLPRARRIRVVSISDGAFAERADSADWASVSERAKRVGLVLVTCDRRFVRFGMLQRAWGADPGDAGAYRPSRRYAHDDDALRVPGTRALAAPAGRGVYTFFPDGGMSWGAPYLAGLAALACQVRPDVRPAEIAAALVATARRTDAGPIVDPEAFIERVRARR